MTEPIESSAFYVLFEALLTESESRYWQCIRDDLVYRQDSLILYAIAMNEASIAACPSPEPLAEIWQATGAALRSVIQSDELLSVRLTHSPDPKTFWMAVYQEYFNLNYDNARLDHLQRTYFLMGLGGPELTLELGFDPSGLEGPDEDDQSLSASLPALQFHKHVDVDQVREAIYRGIVFSEAGALEALVIDLAQPCIRERLQAFYEHDLLLSSTASPTNSAAASAALNHKDQASRPDSCKPDTGQEQPSPSEDHVSLPKNNEAKDHNSHAPLRL